MLKFFQKYLKKREKTEPYRLGDAFSYRGSCLIVVDVRESPAIGPEYIVYLDGETHGWLTHSILKGLEQGRNNDKF